MRFLTLTALLLLAYPSETQSRQIDIPAAIKAAYEMGKQERLMLTPYESPKILTIEEIERLI